MFEHLFPLHKVELMFKEKQIIWECGSAVTLFTDDSFCEVFFHFFVLYFRVETNWSSYINNVGYILAQHSLQ